MPPTTATVFDNQSAKASAQAWVEHTPSLITFNGMDKRCRLLTVRFLLTGREVLPTSLSPAKILLRQQDGRGLMETLVQPSDIVRSSDGTEMAAVARVCEPDGIVFNGSAKPSAEVFAAMDVLVAGEPIHLTAPRTNLYVPF